MALEHISNCPLCENTSFSPYLETEDFTVSHGTFQIVRCNKCQLLITNPRPSAASIGQYYDSTAYISHHDDTGSLLATAYNQVRKLTTRQKIRTLEHYTGKLPKTILDIGCGTGYFLSECQQSGWEIEGTEPDADARKAAEQKTGRQLAASIQEASLQDRPFSAITLWHVLEHIHELNPTLEWLSKHLDPKGTLFIAVPNPESVDAQKYRKYWAAYDLPRHLYHFTKATMEKLLTKHHFQLIEIKNMLFDSYYVSLLSTRYQYGKNRPFEGFISGTLSNLQGFGINNASINTSSLLYIIKKK